MLHEKCHFLRVILILFSLFCCNVRLNLWLQYTPRKSLKREREKERMEEWAIRGWECKNLDRMPAYIIIVILPHMNHTDFIFWHQLNMPGNDVSSWLGLHGYVITNCVINQSFHSQLPWKCIHKTVTDSLSPFLSPIPYRKYSVGYNFCRIHIKHCNHTKRITIN